MVFLSQAMTRIFQQDLLRVLLGLLIPCVGFGWHSRAVAQSFSIDHHAVSGGGGLSRGGEFSLFGTIEGLTDSVTMRGGNFSLQSGFLGTQSRSARSVLPPVPQNSVPRVSDILNREVVEDSGETVFNFTVSDAETPASSLEVNVASSNTTLIPLESLRVIGSQSNRNLVIIPAANASGTSEITISVSDGVNQVKAAFTLTVTPINDPPEILVSAPVVTDEDLAARTLIRISDAESPVEQLSVTVESLTDSLLPSSNLSWEFADSGIVLSIVPASNQFGDGELLINVSDGDVESEARLEVSVTAIDDPPFVDEISLITLIEDEPALVEFRYGDIDTAESDLRLSVLEVGGGLFSDQGLLLERAPPVGRLRLKPKQNAFGNGSVVFTIEDSSSSVTQQIPITIQAVNDPPVFAAIADVELDVNEPSVVTFLISDPDNHPDQLAFDLVSLNRSLVPDSEIEFFGQGLERSFIIRPALDQRGKAVIIVGVSDGNEIDLTRFNVSVGNSGSEIEPETPPAARLQIQAMNEVIVIRWDTKGVLMSASRIEGPYEPIVGAMSPFQLDSKSSERMYFRVVTSAP